MLYTLIVVSGTLAGIGLLFTAMSGLLHMDMELHEISALTTVLLAFIHFGLIRYKNWRIKRSAHKKTTVVQP